MSDKGSEDGDGAVRRDSAYSLQGLDQLSIESPFHDWQQNTDRPGFHERTVVRAYRFHPDPESIPRTMPQYPPSSTPSFMPTTVQGSAAGSMISSLTDLSRIPTLVTGSSRSALSNLSPASEYASVIARPGPIDEEGNLQPGDVQCDWPFLLCFKIVSADAFHEHSKSHFKSHEPPKIVHCPFARCEWSHEANSGERAWSQREYHIETEHSLGYSARVDWKKPHRSLIQHLFNMRIVPEIQIQELRVHGQISRASEVYTASHGPREDRRREGRSHHSGRRAR